jgi:hypothetical protein
MLLILAEGFETIVSAAIFEPYFLSTSIGMSKAEISECYF